MGIGGAICLGFGIYLGFEYFGTSIGFFILGISLITVISSFIYGLKVQPWEKFSLKETMTSTVNESIGITLKVGNVGLATSDLKPVGKALFENEEIEVIYCELNYDTNSSIDSSAFVLLKINNSINVTLIWAYNVSYKNEINIWGDEGTLLNKRVFSKPVDFSSEFVFSNTKGNNRIEIIEPSNHFHNMFNVFYGNIFDKFHAKKHKDIVIKRANLLEKLLLTNVNSL